ncbi:hypothetical protein WJX74_009500 [Apatococcus lobatus]|uniref:Uncharacterized protein n=1 Tax=Apatococcus lobatus TaxID=904363 RepID=A0AAW1Q5Q1_9CHLO
MLTQEITTGAKLKIEGGAQSGQQHVIDLSGTDQGSLVKHEAQLTLAPDQRPTCSNRRRLVRHPEASGCQQHPALADLAHMAEGLAQQHSHELLHLDPQGMRIVASCSAQYPATPVSPTARQIPLPEFEQPSLASGGAGHFNKRSSEAADLGSAKPAAKAARLSPAMVGYQGIDIVAGGNVQMAGKTAEKEVWQPLKLPEACNRATASEAAAPCQPLYPVANFPPGSQGDLRRASLERLSRKHQCIFAILELQPQENFTSKRISRKLAQLGLKTLEGNHDNIFNTLLTGTPAADQSKPYVGILDKMGKGGPRNWNEKGRQMLSLEWFNSWYWELTQYLVEDESC